MLKDVIARYLTAYLTEETGRPDRVTGLGFDWWEVVMPGDVILVEGSTRISTAIKYLTQSTWSHAALVVQCEQGEILEADVKNGVVFSAFDKYKDLNVRICRPIRLTDEDRNRLIAFASTMIGVSYDLKNLTDLARYLLPTPPVPTRFRRQMLALGSGDPTEKLICSSMIARTFQHIGYPILPIQWQDESGELLSRVRHHSLIVPRDFDLSPYFEVIKPTAVRGFDYRQMRWQSDAVSPPP